MPTAMPTASAVAAAAITAKLTAMDAQQQALVSKNKDAFFGIKN